jgi:hypothetical protein
MEKQNSHVVALTCHFLPFRFGADFAFHALAIRYRYEVSTDRYRIDASSLSGLFFHMTDDGHSNFATVRVTGS